MALGSVAGAVAGSVASAGASKLFGGSKKTPKVDTSAATGPVYTPLFTAQRATDGTLQVSQTPQLTEISRQRGVITNQIVQNLQQQRNRVAPGFGELTRTRVNAIRDNRDRVVGNLRDNLARRRISGSRFASDDIARTEREFARQEDLIRAESFLQELDATVRLVTQEGTLRLNNLEQWLNDLKIPSEAALALSSSGQAALSSASQLNARLAAEAQAGRGAFFGDAIDSIGGAVERGIGNIFSPQVGTPPFNPAA